MEQNFIITVILAYNVVHETERFVTSQPWSIMLRLTVTHYLVPQNDVISEVSFKPMSLKPG